ncbi:MAG: ABC transporter ATP-binding protein [Bacteroidetes bacterium]|nr:ABC transporter ATP-binding protein [Bacteroidota bacterium]
MLEYIIKIDALSKIYRKDVFDKQPVAALNNVSLSFYQGEIVAVLGVNGAGKTTLTKCMLQLVRPTSGKVLFNEHVLNRKKSSIGYLPEHFRVPPYCTARGVLHTLGLMSGMERSELNKRIELVLQLVGLDDRRNSFVKEYSKGMIVRLGIAQAILHNPQLLFLDEPTDALDPLGKIMVRNLLRDLSNQGVTIVVNSHLLTEIELIAHRAVILHKGNVIREGNIGDLLAGQAGFFLQLSSYIEMPPPYSCSYNGKVWICEVQSTQELQQALDILRGKGVTPLNVIPKRTTLEDLFIRTIEEQ